MSSRPSQPSVSRSSVGRIVPAGAEDYRAAAVACSAVASTAARAAESALRAATSFREGGQLDMPRPSTHALRVEAQAALDSVPSAVTK